MPNVIEDLLTNLDTLIRDHRLQESDVDQPVCLAPLLEEAITYFVVLPEPVKAISVHWDGRAGISYNWELKDPDRSYDKRHADGHELGHILGRHRGHFVLWQIDPDEAADFDRFLGKKLEHECEIVASYLLVSRRALDSFEGFDIWDIARLIDVPPHLVKLRYEIADRYGK